MEFQGSFRHLIRQCCHVSGEPSGKCCVVGDVKHGRGGQGDPSFVIICLKDVDRVVGICGRFGCDKVRQDAARFGFFDLGKFVHHVLHNAGNKTAKFGSVAKGAVKLIAENGNAVLILGGSIEVCLNDFRFLYNEGINGRTVGQGQTIVGGIQCAVDEVDLSSYRAPSSLVYVQ